MENSHPREKDEEQRSDEEEHDDHHDISGAEVPPEFGEPGTKSNVTIRSQCFFQIMY